METFLAVLIDYHLADSHVHYGKISHYGMTSQKVNI